MKFARLSKPASLAAVCNNISNADIIWEKANENHCQNFRSFFILLFPASVFFQHQIMLCLYGKKYIFCYLKFGFGGLPPLVKLENKNQIFWSKLDFLIDKTGNICYYNEAVTREHSSAG